MYQVDYQQMRFLIFHRWKERQRVREITSRMLNFEQRFLWKVFLYVRDDLCLKIVKMNLIHRAKDKVQMIWSDISQKSFRQLNRTSCIIPTTMTLHCIPIKLSEASDRIPGLYQLQFIEKEDRDSIFVSFVSVSVPHLLFEPLVCLPDPVLRFEHVAQNSNCTQILPGFSPLEQSAQSSRFCCHHLHKTKQ